MDSIHLSGAEDVRRAANTMAHAAEDMKSAANTIAEAIDRQRDFMGEWLMRFEAAVEKMQPPEPEMMAGTEIVFRDGL